MRTIVPGYVENVSMVVGSIRIHVGGGKKNGFIYCYSLVY